MENVKVHSKLFSAFIEDIDEMFLKIENEISVKENELFHLNKKFDILTNSIIDEAEQRTDRITKAAGGEFTIDTVSSLLLKKIQGMGSKEEIDIFINNLMEAQNDIN
jgi:hypothetical protein